MSEGLCTENVDRGHGRWSNPQPCGRVVVKDGLCKLHLRVEEKRAARATSWQQTWDEGEALQDEAEALSEKLGTRVTAEYNPYAKGGGSYTGRFTVPGDWLRGQAGTPGSPAKLIS